MAKTMRATSWTNKDVGDNGDSDDNDAVGDAGGDGDLDGKEDDDGEMTSLTAMALGFTDSTELMRGMGARARRNAIVNRSMSFRELRP